MGFLRNIREKQKEQAKETAKKAIKQQIKKALTPVLMFMTKAIIAVILTGIVLNFFVYIIEIIVAEETPKEIYEQLEVEEVKDLVEIKGNETDGYHLEFVSDIDERLDKLIESLSEKEGMFSINKNDKNLLKDIIKAEVVTQFPDLGGKVDESSTNQFQGAITVRRITPDKEIGELVSTGAGEKVTADDLKAENNEEDEKITYDKGQELEINNKADLYLKGTYNFLGTKESDEGVTEKSDTMVSKIEGVDKSLYVNKGDRVYYTGNEIYVEYNTYIEIAKDKDASIIMGYVKNIYTEVPRNNNTSTENDDNNKDNEEDEEITPTKTIRDGSEEFVIAIAAGRNSSDDKGYSDGEFTEEELTIQVANKVEDLFKEYSNIKVVQTGSTSEKQVKREERTQLAKDANPDLCIQIYFNSGGNGSGIETCYEYGDGKSERLAKLLSEKISDKMNLENRGVVTQEGVSDYYDIIDSSSETDFPSVITKGGFLDNQDDKDTLKNGGIYQYAKGIVEACEEYLISDKGNDTVSYVEQNDTYSRVRSRIYDLTYVPQETFQELITNTDKRALEVYTLDDNYNLLTATWKMEGTTEGNAALTINKNSSMNFRTILQDVTMPYEYLLFFWIESDEKDFVQDLANVVINDTEIIIAVQDSITTTKIETTVQRSTKILSDTGDGADRFARGWYDILDDGDKYTENCRTSVSITYADMWFMKYAKENTYSSEALDVKKGEKVNLIKNVKGKVRENVAITNEGWNDDGSGGIEITTGQAYYVVNENNEDKVYYYTYGVYERKNTVTTTISNTYDDGETIVSGDTSKFIKLYQKYEMSGLISEEWLFDIIASNEKTSNLADLTRYMIYKATDDDYGVTEFDFSEFDLDAFQSKGGMYGATVQEKIWFALLDAGFSKYAAAGALGNIEAESHFDCTIVEIRIR